MGGRRLSHGPAVMPFSGKLVFSYSRSTPEEACWRRACCGGSSATLRQARCRVKNLHQQARRWAQQYRIGHLSRRDVLQRVVLIAGAGSAALALLRKIGVPVEAEEV